MYQNTMLKAEISFLFSKKTCSLTRVVFIAETVGKYFSKYLFIY